jgi:hypothetical protein
VSSKLTEIYIHLLNRYVKMCCDTPTGAANWILFSQNCSTYPDRPWGPPSLLYNGYRVFPGGKSAGAWRWPPTPSSVEVKERVLLYVYSPSGPLWPVLGWTLPLLSVLFYCIRHTEKYTGKIIHIITCMLIHSSSCVLHFRLSVCRIIFFSSKVARTTQKVDQTLLWTRPSNYSLLSC